MKPTRYIALFAVLNALAVFPIYHSTHAAQAKGASQRGGSADSHMSGKAREETNAQWFADPERGWVRADERHDQSGRRSTKEKKASGKKTNERKNTNY